MTATIVRGDARRLPLADASVDLIVTSPPYWALRSYTDDGAHYDGQIGAEATPQAYIASLIECTREWMRVLKPTEPGLMLPCPHAAPQPQHAPFGTARKGGAA